MKPVRCGWMAAVALVLAGSGCHYTHSAKPPPAPPGADAAAQPQLQPLPESDSLLLLEESPASSPASAAFTAMNSRCQVCHLNYAQEPIAEQHAQAAIGCAQCHGPSDEHIADESWASGGQGTAPDIFYRPEQVNPMCLKCHAQNQIDPDSHADLFAERGPAKLCTDCHGEHRLAERKCRWK